jgi:osmoprotectant transport system permease protein
VASLALLQDLSSLEDPRLIEWDWIFENFWDDIAPAIQGHIYLSVVSVAIARATPTLCCCPPDSSAG